MFDKRPNNRFFLYELTVFLSSQGATLERTGCSMSIEKWVYTIYRLKDQTCMIVNTGRGFCYYDQQAIDISDIDINESLYRIESEHYERRKV